MASPKCAHNALVTLLLSYCAVSATFSVNCDHYVVYSELGSEKEKNTAIPIAAAPNQLLRKPEADFYHTEKMLTLKGVLT
jgi:hypothetical protein